MVQKNTDRGMQAQEGNKKQKLFGALASKAGSVLPMVLVMGATGIVSVLALMQYVQPLASSFARSSEMILYRVAMDGLLDYSIGAIKQNKCFNNTMMWMECADLTSAYNTERLLMSSESVEKIAMSTTTPIPAAPLTTTLPLKSMEFDFEILSSGSPITAAHPLSAIIEPIKFKLQDGTYSPTHSIKSFKLVISRVTDVNVPQNDNFALLKFTVTLTPNNTSTFFNTGTLSAEAVVVFSPRRLAGNALVLANNMDLTGNGTSTATSSRLPSFASMADGGKGLRFESPVIINQNLILPSPNGSVYAPVSFTDKVYLGGRVYYNSVDDANLSKPTHSGHPAERYYSQFTRTHGFMNGIDLDPFPDGGLPYLFDSTSVNVPNDSLNRCLARSKALTDKTVTRESRLYAAYRGATDTGDSRRFDFYLSLGQINFFIPQSTPLGASIGAQAQSSNFSVVTPTVMNSTIADPDLGLNSDYPIARVTVKVTNFVHPALPPTWPAFNEFYVSGNVGRNGVLDMPLGNGAAIQVKIAPKANHGRYQTGEVEMSVTLINQTAMLGLLPNRAVTTCPGMPWTPSVAGCDPGTPAQFLQYAITSYEPSRIAVDVEAFDVAYRNGTTQRLHYIPTDREASSAHPFFGSTKKQQFLFTRGIADVAYTLAQGSTPLPISTSSTRHWVECNSESAISPRTTDSESALTGDLANCKYPSGIVPYFPSPGEELLHKPLVEDVDLESIYDDCRITVPPGSAFTPSFGALAWYYSAAQAPDLNSSQKKDVIRHAWGFVPGYNTLSPPDPVLGAPGSTDQGYIEKLTFNENSSKVDDVTTPAFVVQARVKTCEVEDTANFVTGLFVCDKFVIKARTTPLRIIATVIAGELVIDESAVKQGIRWSSVFSANSMFELQRAGILNSLASCTSSALPHWYPKANAKQSEQLSYCLPGYLTNQVDPFNWTMIDPDCIRNPDSPAKMICKRHPRRYVAREITRNYTP